MKVWIEVQDPTDENSAKDICDKANAMMNKLGVAHKVFAPNTLNRHSDYIAWDSPEGGFTCLEDNGKWFNLEYLGKV